MEEYKDLIPTRASLLSRLMCSHDFEKWLVQHQFCKLVLEAASRLPVKPLNCLREVSSLRVTPTATTEAVKSKTLVCNSRRLSVISSLVGKFARRTMSPMIDTATEGIIFPRISGFKWAIGARNRTLVPCLVAPYLLFVDRGLTIIRFRALSLLDANPKIGFTRNLGEEQLFAAEEFGGLSVRPVSVEAAKGDVLEGTRLGAGEPHLQHVIPSRETEGFKRLGANLSVLPWLAALNKKGCGSRESMDWQAKSSN
jgi:hypothetical protein